MKPSKPTTLQDFRVVFDNNCPMCQQLANWGVKQHLIPATNITGYDFLEPGDRAKVDPVRFKNEVAVIGPDGEGTSYGLTAIWKIMSHHGSIYKRIKPGTVLFRLLEPLYKVGAINRYLFWAKPAKYACHCEPDVPASYRLGFVLMNLIAAIAVVFPAAAALGIQLGWPVLKAVPWFLAVTASGWLIMAAFNRLAMSKKQWFEYIGQLSVIQLVGVLFLLPTIAGFWLPAMAFFPLFWLCVGMSFLTMFKMHLHRTVRFKHNWALTLGWTAVLTLCSLTGLAITKEVLQWTF